MHDRIQQAFERFPRELFLPASAKQAVGINAPVSIGFGQTNSQPSTVRWMLEQLQVRQGDCVLDIGSGSGWTTALLSYLAGEAGSVIAVERIPQLVQLGRENYEKAGASGAEFHQAGGVFGWPESGPYDRILVSASANTLPPELKEQLKEGGRMVIPIKDSIWVMDKRDGELRGVKHPGFLFVPLIP